MVICAEKATPADRSSDRVLALSTGDPTMFEPYWRKMGDKGKVVIRGGDLMSYFSDMKNECWFLEPELRDAIRRLHRVVGNAVTDDRHVVAGTGSTQLFQALLYALTTPGGAEPVSVVSSAPYYSSYPEVVELLRSELYKWAGDANTFDKDGPYIEVVCSPNNPDGAVRQAVVNRGDQRQVIYDLAYYWPQYTAITGPADHDIMLFTSSKCTGHAGSRVGWAIVKDKDVAKKMIEYITISSIGVSKESQVRAAKIIGAVCDGCQGVGSDVESDNFFEYARDIMSKRWQKVRQALDHQNEYLNNLIKYPRQRCLFTGEFTESLPAYAWLKCKGGIEDCEEFFSGRGIVGKGGKRFGADPKFNRISLLCREEDFNLFVERLGAIARISNGL
ncbi:L-tryptophan--pyruvate aminotransferase 1 [Morella rubra]|uniref:L-tryptophan--pyruvate aminotransferase 1 n=1 Tax=Morella rubra TaxID=262757 RepID=A0A6A1V639_9ROSI|nr:L-tryptophan--pyruvate aminotransferase 1 [Morella rubra]